MARLRIVWLAIVLLVVAACARSHPSPSAEGTGEWHWQKVSIDIMVNGATEVPNGFVALCLDTATIAISLCTSPDGVKWSSPPDPSIFTKTGSGQFYPQTIVKGPGAYLASTPDTVPAGGFSPLIWRSTDGVSWTQVDPPSKNAPVVSWDVIGLRDRFLAGNSMGGRWYESIDGLSWTPYQSQPELEFIDGDQERGLRGSATGRPEYYSVDGRKWDQVSLPNGLTDFYRWWVRMPNGHLLATAGANIEGNPGQPGTLVQSTNGIGWTVVSSFTGNPYQPIEVTGMTFLTAESRGSDPDQIWQSQDSGATWSRALPDSEGEVTIIALGHGRLVLQIGSDEFVGSR